MTGADQNYAYMIENLLDVGFWQFNILGLLRLRRVLSDLLISAEINKSLRTDQLFFGILLAALRYVSF